MSEEIIVFFDNDCLMCQAGLRWLNRLDSEDRLRFAPYDGETAKKCGILTDDDSMGIVIDGEIYRSSEAARLAFREAGGLGKVIAGILKVIPLRVRECAYRWIARHRKSLVKNESCGLPEEGMREKLLE